MDFFLGRRMARDTIGANNGEARMTDKANRTVTRRRVIASTAIALGGLAVSGGPGAAQEKSTKAGAIIATTAIHQEEDFNASAQSI
jgi:hypothetical protein